MDSISDFPAPWRERSTFSSDLDPREWLRTPDAEKYSNLRATRLYELAKTKQIKSFLLKKGRDCVRGIRLWSRSSIDAFFEKSYEEALSEGNPAGYVSWQKERLRH